MDVLKLPAAAGVAWIRGGFTLMFHQFIGFLMLVMTYLFAFVVAGYGANALGGLAGLIGADASVVGKTLDLGFAMLAPALAVGFMAACRAAAAGQRVTPAFILAGFRGGRKSLLSLLGLGVFQVTTLFLIQAALATTQAPGAPDPDSFAALTSSFDTSGMSDEATAQLLLVRTVALLARVAVSVVLWYAPVLVAWHGMRAVKSTFYSVAACWRNRGAFAIFGFGWVALWLTVIGIVGIFGLLGLGDNARMLFWPIAPVMFAAMYCSIYVTYASVFVSTVKAAPIVPVPEPRS
jgi:hypothetical protein